MHRECGCSNRWLENDYVAGEIRHQVTDLNKKKKRLDVYRIYTETLWLKIRWVTKKSAYQSAKIIHLLQGKKGKEE